MKLHALHALALTVVVSPLPYPAAALTMDQFVNICASSQYKCSDHPLLQAYVGGALDLVAVLDEETDYLSEIYCKAPDVLFDVGAIIQYMEVHSETYMDKNAMLLVVRYLEKNGRCP